MAKKTFISYKYSEARNIRDEILDSLGDDASYYVGETADSPDLTNTTIENIKRNLRDMIHKTSVTIVVISPNYAQSKWIDWEIEYSLKEIPRQDRISRTNGVVGVVMKVNGSYDWLIEKSKSDDDCTIRTIKNDNLTYLVKKNRYNLISDEKYACSHCKSYSQLDGSYIALIEEELFLKNPSKYIENAFKKSQSLDDYDLVKVRQ
jgi:MTH538 TIR-like domain (DUF1863)